MSESDEMQANCIDAIYEADIAEEERQCDACGDWIGGAEPCPCGLLPDDWARSHWLALTVREVYGVADHATFAQALVLRHNLTVIASMAETAAKAIDDRLRTPTECAHCGRALVHVYGDRWEHQASGSLWCVGAVSRRATPVFA